MECSPLFIEVGHNFFFNHLCVFLNTVKRVFKICGPENQSDIVLCVTFRSKLKVGFVFRNHLHYARKLFCRKHKLAFFDRYHCFLSRLEVGSGNPESTIAWNCCLICLADSFIVLTRSISSSCWYRVS